MIGSGPGSDATYGTKVVTLHYAERRCVRLLAPLPLLPLRLCMTLRQGPDVYRFVHPECAGVLSGNEPGRALNASRRVAAVRV